METIEEAAYDSAEKLACDFPDGCYREEMSLSEIEDWFKVSFKEGVAFAQNWISVEDELPETPLTDIENVQYSEHILLKVNGYDHPFIGYYMKANDDEFFEFVPESITNEFMQELITHWRLIDLK
jgi:hypothetical protein